MVENDQQTESVNVAPDSSVRENAKSYIIKILIGSLIGSAIIAVVAIMSGGFTETIERAIWTLVLVMLHSLIGLALVMSRKGTDDPKSRTLSDVLNVSNDILLVLTLVSTFTSVLLVWGLDSDLGGKLYSTYLIIAIAVTHSEALYKMRTVTTTLEKIVLVNLSFIVVVALGLIIGQWAEWDTPELYNRFLASLGVIDATLTVLAIILYSLFVRSNPDFNSPLEVARSGRHGSSLGRIAIILLALFFLGPFVLSLLFFMLISLFN